MVINFIALLAGLAVLVYSADKFISGTAAIARNHDVSPLLIGLAVFTGWLIRTAASEKQRDPLGDEMALELLAFTGVSFILGYGVSKAGHISRGEGFGLVSADIGYGRFLYRKTAAV